MFIFLYIKSTKKKCISIFIILNNFSFFGNITFIQHYFFSKNVISYRAAEEGLRETFDTLAHKTATYKKTYATAQVLIKTKTFVNISTLRILMLYS